VSSNRDRPIVHRNLTEETNRWLNTEIPYLNWREIMLHVIHGCPVFNLGTGLGPSHTSERWAPVLDALHVAPQPRGVLGGVVLPVRPPRHLRAAASRRDGEGEGREAEEHRDDEHDGEEVEPQRPRDVEAGAHEAGEGDDEHGEADDQERRLQDRGARGRGGLGQPQPRPDDGDRRQERGQVEVADEQVAEAVRIHLCCACSLLLDLVPDALLATD
jgi:hypothetical protein